VPTQPTRRVVELRDRSLGVSPCPPVQEHPEHPAVGGVLVPVVAVRIADLPRVLVRRLWPLGVLLEAGGILNLQLLRQMLNDRPRHNQGILQEQPDVPDRSHLHGEAQAIMVTSPLRVQAPVHVVEEEALQLGPRRFFGEASIGLSLLISQKFHGHETDNSRSTNDRESSDETPHNLGRLC
jgi:hypothetical protein